MKKITFNKTQGGIANTPVNEDYFGGLYTFSDTLPAEWLPEIDAWVTLTAYVVGDKVYDTVSKNFYICKTAHTSAAAFITDIANWDVYVYTVKEFNRLIDVENAGITKTNADTKLLHYQFSEAFRIFPDASISTYIEKVPSGAYTFSGLYHLQKQSGGKLRQAIVIADKLAYDIVQLNSLQTQIDLLSNENMPIQVIYAADFSANTSVALYPDILNLATPAPGVSVLNGQDGDAYGSTLSFSVDLGAVLGALENCKVSQSPADYGAFQYASTELLNPAIAGIGLISQMTSADVDALAAKGYMFFVNEVGTTGTFLNDSLTATDKQVDDFYDIQINRVYHKAVRGMNKANLPLVNRELLLDPSTGRMADRTINYIKEKVSMPLYEMLKAKEFSGFSVYIDPTQNVQATSLVEITVTMVANATARKYTIKTGFVPNL